MRSRRSFFSRVAAVIAIVALAPEIAFGRKLDFADMPVVDWKSLAFWTENESLSEFYTERYIEFINEVTKDTLKREMIKFYEEKYDDWTGAHPRS